MFLGTFGQIKVPFQPQRREELKEQVGKVLLIEQNSNYECHFHLGKIVHFVMKFVYCLLVSTGIAGLDELVSIQKTKY